MVPTGASRRLPRAQTLSAARSSRPISACDSRASSSAPIMDTKPWIMSSWRLTFASTPASPQLLGVRLALVAQRVVTGRDDHRGGQPRVVVGQERRGEGVPRAGLVLDVVPVEPPHPPGRQEVALGVLRPGGVLAPDVHGRVDEDLVGDLRPAPVAGHERDDRRQVASRGVPRDREALPVRPEVGGVLGEPAGGRVAVLRRRREGALRGEAVLHGGHGATRGARQGPAGGVVRLDAPDDPAPAVEVDD